MPRKAQMAEEPDVSKTTVDTLSAPHVQEAFQQLQRENTALRRENAQLRQQLQTAEDWEHRTTQYQRERTEGGAVVYVFTGTPKHYACPHCFSTHALQCLQEQHAASGTFACPGCRASYPIKPAAIPTKRVLRKASLWSS
jgi:cell division septum initiation protein DivIVA